MKQLILIPALLFSALAVADNKPLVVPADKVNAGCSDFDTKVEVLKAAGQVIYQSSAYLIINNCIDDSRRVDAVFAAGRVLNKKVQYRLKGSVSDFRVVNDDGTPAMISPIGLRVVCEDINAGDRWLDVQYQGTTIYTTSRYQGWGGCPEASAKLETKLNAARTAGSMLNFKPGNSPQNDFSISNVADPAGPSSQRTAPAEEPTDATT